MQITQPQLRAELLFYLIVYDLDIEQDFVLLFMTYDSGIAQTGWHH